MRLVVILIALGMATYGTLSIWTAPLWLIVWGVVAFAIIAGLWVSDSVARR